MSGKSPIQWTEKSWNPVVGCKRVSAGCDHCYAFALHDKRHIAWKRGNWPSAPAQYHLPFSRVQVLEARLLDPFSWRDGCRVFVNSMSDLWEERVPDNFIAQMFGVMALTPRHTYQILTKRPERMRDWMRSHNGTDCVAAFTHSNMGRAIYGTRTWRYNVRKAKHQRAWPLDNIWLGVSVEDQAAADERIPLLLQTPAAVRFLSCEPLLGPIRLRDLLFHECADGCRCRWPDDPDANECACGGECQYAEDWGANPGIDWIIVGGESGKHARFVDLVDVEDLISQCRWAGIAPFVKQLGSVWAKQHFAHDHHGGDMSEWPEHLRVREYPAAVTASSTAESEAH